MDETYQALRDLQELDDRMDEARKRVERFDPELEELDAPIRAAEEEVTGLRKRVEEMRAELRRLERGAEDKGAQLAKYQARLERVRNPREEAAARTEIDLISRAVDADETDALNLMDQLKRTDLKLDELEKKLEKLKEETAPRRSELVKGREEAEDQLGILADQRKNRIIRLDPGAARLYERIRGGRGNMVVAPLTPDGACGHCFSVVPIQEQNEIRRGGTLHRCEACGVILYPVD